MPHLASDEQILERLVALNHERAAEEARGIVRWLRPDFQNSAGGAKTQATLELPEEPDEKTTAKPTVAKAKKEPWPKPLPERIRAVRTALARHGSPALPEEIAAGFVRAQKASVAELLDTLVTVGQARRTEDGRYIP